MHCKRKRSNITMFHINLFLAYILRATTSILKDYLLWNGFALSKDVQQNGEMFGFKDDSSVSGNNDSVWCLLSNICHEIPHGVTLWEENNSTLFDMFV